MFRSRDFPGDPTRLFHLLDNANKRIGYAAASALSRIRHPAIRSFALQLITEGRPDIGTRLLRSSYGDGDLALFKELLDQLVSDEDAHHSVGLSVLNVNGDMANKPQEAQAVLLHLYENEPCSLCRGTAVDQLAAMDGIPDWMAEEGSYDAEPAVAERFRPSRPQSH